MTKNRESTAQAGAAKREDFEAWMVSEGYGEVPRICLPGSPCAGEYANQYWHRSWVAWQAGRARAAAPNVLAMREALQGLLAAIDSTDEHDMPSAIGGELIDAARAALASPLPEPRPYTATDVIHDREAYFARAALPEPRAGDVELRDFLCVQQTRTYLDGLAIPALDDNGASLSLIDRINIMTAKCVKAKKDLAESYYQTACVLEERLNASEVENERLRALAASPTPTPEPQEGRKPLTEDKVREIAEQHTTHGTVDGAHLFYQVPFARAIERAYGIGSQDATK